MIRMYLSKAAHALQAIHRGADVEFRGVSTDSRTLQADNLFVALSGPKYDAHHFIYQALARGASAALLSQQIEISLPTLQVADTRLALGQLANAWRLCFELPVVAVTGSNGKTTVKEMIASILGQGGAGLVTQGNLNNDIGVPLTLLQLDAAHRFAVIEMGANHAGEIAYLTRLTHPGVALITNAGPAHLEGFGSVEGVAHAKGEIFQGLNEQGVAVINADDAYAPLWRRLAGARRSVSFGLTQPADVSADWEACGDGSLVHMRTPHGVIDVDLPLPGRHNVLNALAATAAALAAGAVPAQVKQGLEAMQSVRGRLQTKPGLYGARVIDDTYNANPASFTAAIHVLAQQPDKRWLVLGDMGELGADAPALHAQVGKTARDAGIDRLYAVGPLSQAAVQAFGPGGVHRADQGALVMALQSALAETQDKVTLLVKGSRSAHMETVVAGLVAATVSTEGEH